RASATQSPSRRSPRRSRWSPQSPCSRCCNELGATGRSRPPRTRRAMTPALPSLQAGEAFLDYLVVRPIAAGGYGEVYEALEQFTERPVALKILKLDRAANEITRRRNKQEAILLSRLNHKNIVKVFAANTLPDGRIWMAMELLHGSP